MRMNACPDAGTHRWDTILAKGRPSIHRPTSSEIAHTLRPNPGSSFIPPTTTASCAGPENSNYIPSLTHSIRTCLWRSTGDIDILNPLVPVSADGMHHPRVITLGGDHTIVLPLLRSIYSAYGAISVIHFDSHLDTWKPQVFGGAPSAQAALLSNYL